MNSFFRLARTSFNQTKTIAQRGGHGPVELGTSEYSLSPSVHAAISLSVKLSAFAFFFAYPFAVIRYQRSKKESG
ncbi:hypothetical protein DDB_G0284823 [Dictyostelium discoideum AX4]|uniref:Uncharacterized protein n=1 Tax=Dictyostelium discoideum TaxID=44689 RepID=Q54P31_DICDI|nr:hypothetical protein DDB_G0284823 [Dictyostelium discoideum AX4]EAL65064.1 hypothetical protein DDB_G0284823 [Dictyostelium discoideum AX4]|eukprot:XP_638427.1 hypothetical protein DDB_G0284823 [Dictyostelium discoideum AX4]